MEKSLNKKIKYADLWGLREEKYEWLGGHDIENTKWEELTPSKPFYYFIPKEDKGREVYDTFWKITDIFPVNSVGIVTARDKLTVKWSEEEIWNTVVQFSNMEAELARRCFNLGKDVRDWKVILAQEDIKGSGLKREFIIPILYTDLLILDTPTIPVKREVSTACLD